MLTPLGNSAVSACRMMYRNSSGVSCVPNRTLIQPRSALELYCGSKQPCFLLSRRLCLPIVVFDFRKIQSAPLGHMAVCLGSIYNAFMSPIRHTRTILLFTCNNTPDPLLGSCRSDAVGRCRLGSRNRIGHVLCVDHTLLELFGIAHCLKELLQE